MEESLVIRPSGIDGVGAFATRDVARGETFHQMGGRPVHVVHLAIEIVRRRVRFEDPFPIGDREYLVLDPVSRAINHCCEPNAGFRGEREMFALRDIAAGDEVTYDYSMVTPRRWYARTWKLDCTCGAPTCRKVIRDIRTMPQAQLRAHLDAGALLDYIARRA